MPHDSNSEAIPGFADWQRAVADVLGKARKVDPAQLPDQPQTLLDTVTYDGITVAPLYTARDEQPELPGPGGFPFVRGRVTDRGPRIGWHVSARFGGPDADVVNREIISGLEAGVSAIWLAVGEAGVAVDSLDAALAGVMFDLAPLTLDAGAAITDAAQRLLSILDRYRADDRTGIVVGLGAAPWTSRFAGEGDADTSAAVELAKVASARAETIRAITVDGTVFHDAGAADVEELGAAAAAGLQYMRDLTSAGLTVGCALRQIDFRFAATDDQFMTIAKFRAARRIWARIAQVCGAPDSGAAPQHAVTSAAMMTQRDPWVNMLRTTLAAFGAGVGGADAVTVLPLDAALPPGALGVSSTFAARMARNTQLLLLEESHLGRVLDPGAGSWYVERLTDAVAEKAWAFLQNIEAAGGYPAALDTKLIHERIAETRAKRESDVAHKRTVVTGVNEFPNLAEKPIPTQGSPSHRVARYAAAFEALRDRSDAHLTATGSRPTATLIPLGPVAEHNSRITFAANFLASGGIETLNPGPLRVDGIAAAVHESGTAMAVLCASGERYTDEGDAAISALRDSGVATVLATARPKEISGEQLPDGYICAGTDAVDELSRLLTTLGA